MSNTNKQECILGLDLGTSGVKGLLIDRRGKLLESSRESYSLIKSQSGSWVEQDPMEWWKAARKVISDLKLKGRRLEGVGVTGQVNGLVMVGENGQPLGNALIWMDRRSNQAARSLDKDFCQLIRSYSNASPTALFALSKLKWLADNRPSLLEEASKLLFPKDFLIYKLTGKFTTDVTDAAAGLMLNLEDRNWASEILSEMVSPEQLPPLHESTDIVGRTKSEFESSGLRGGIPVTAGAGDLATAALGSGVVTPGSSCITLGTAGDVSAYLSDLPSGLDPRIWILCHAIPGRYLWHGMVKTAGYAVTWYLDTFGGGDGARAPEKHGDPYDLLLEGVDEVGEGSEGLLFLSHLEGVANPYHNSLARGVFLGITSDHDKDHFTRAVLEGVAFSYREIFEIMAGMGGEEISAISVTAGAARVLSGIELSPTSSARTSK